MRHTPGAEHTLASMLLALGRLKRRIGSAKKAASAATRPRGHRRARTARRRGATGRVPAIAQPANLPMQT